MTTFHTVDGKKFELQQVSSLAAYIALTFWSPSTVAGRLIKSAADLTLALRWFTAEVNREIWKEESNQENHL